MATASAALACPKPLDHPGSVQPSAGPRPCWSLRRGVSGGASEVERGDQSIAHSSHIRGCSPKTHPQAAQVAHQPEAIAKGRQAPPRRGRSGRCGRLFTSRTSLSPIGVRASS